MNMDLIRADILGAARHAAIVSGVVSFALCLMAFYCLDWQQAKCIVFMFINSKHRLRSLNQCMLACMHAYSACPSGASYVQIMGAIDYYYTADKTCVPDGPHLSMTYYITVSNVGN